MLNKEDDIKYSKIINGLKGLQKVKAPDYFEANLMRKINSQDYKEKAPLSIWEKILMPSRFVASASLAVAAVVLLFLVNTGSDDLINPLSAKPRIIEDMLPASETNILQDNEEINMTENFLPIYYKSGAMFMESKTGLNFRQVILSPEEKEKLKQLKEKIKEIWDSGNFK